MTNRQHQERRTAALEEAIAAESPEGRPAHPGLGPLGITVVIGLVAALLFGVAIILALTARTSLAIAFAAVGSLAFVCNPVFWASISRARERARIIDEDAS